jgi:hypothetical protein
VFPVIVGKGFTVNVNICDEPEQFPRVGVTVIVLVIGVDNVFIAVNEFIFPDPEAAKPIFILEFVQLKVAPAVPLKITVFVVEPAQTVWLLSTTKDGIGFIV